LPFRRVDPPRRRVREFVFAATGRQSAAGEMEVSAKVVNLREDAIVEVCDRQRLRFSQGRKGVVDTRDKPIGRCLPEQRPAPVALGLAPQQRSAISLKRFKPASRVLLQVAVKQGEVDNVLVFGCERQPAGRESDGLIVAKEARLDFGRRQIGPRRLRVCRAVQMFGSQHGIVDEYRGGGFVQFSPSCMGKRAVDAIAHQRMGELEPVPDRPHEDVSHECVAGIARLLKQRLEMRQTETLAEDRRRLDGSPILHRQKIGAGEHDILNRVRKPPVGEVPRASQQLLEEQGIAARPLDALGHETLGADETPGD
jgi:hypothetical protein